RGIVWQVQVEANSSLVGDERHHGAPSVPPGGETGRSVLAEQSSDLHLGLLRTYRCSFRVGHILPPASWFLRLSASSTPADAGLLHLCQSLHRHVSTDHVHELLKVLVARLQLPPLTLSGAKHHRASEIVGSHFLHRYVTSPLR